MSIVPDHVEQELLDADPRTCPGCHSARLEDLDGRLFCETIGCTWAAGDRAARIAEHYDRMGPTERFDAAFVHGWVDTPGLG